MLNFIGYTCNDCGMDVLDNEFHSDAACLMFKACQDPLRVRKNIEDIKETAYIYSIAFVESSAQNLAPIDIAKRLEEKTILKK